MEHKTTTTAILIFVAFHYSFGQPKQTYDASKFTNVIENCDRTTELRLEGSAWDNTLVRKCKIHDTGSGNVGIFLKNVKNVVITDCEIWNISGIGGIQLSVSGSTDNVTIDGNIIHDVQQNGMSAGQRSEDSPPVDHLNTKIYNNQVYNTGLSSSGGSYHGLYIQVSDFLIEGNIISGIRDGNGISIRSSGIVRGNTVSGNSKANKPAIRYFTDHEKGPSNLLIIENNIAYNDGTDANVIDIPAHAPRYDGYSGTDHIVKNFKIRFNTSISFKSNRSAIYLDADYSGSLYTVEAYGNILVNTLSTSYLTGPIDVDSKNYKTQSLNGFVKNTAPYNFHIVASSGARGFATGETRIIPSIDIDGEPRLINNLDAGADQYCAGTTPWANNTFAQQTGIFSVNFDVTPAENNMDGMVGLSNGAATAYTDVACIVRFNLLGNIDARNGSAYQATNTVPYTSGISYHVKMDINISTKKYDIYVTPQGGTQQVVGSNYDFRTEQNTITQLNNWTTSRSSCVLEVKNFTIAMTTNSRNNSADSGTKIYPNPASEKIIIETDFFSEKEIKIFSIFGEGVYSGKIDKYKAVDVSAFPEGVYIVSIPMGQKIIYKKILIQRHVAVQ